MSQIVSSAVLELVWGLVLVAAQVIVKVIVIPSVQEHARLIVRKSVSVHAKVVLQDVLILAVGHVLGVVNELMT